MVKLFLNKKLELIQTVKFVKQLFRIQIKKGGKVLLWSQPQRSGESVLFPGAPHTWTYNF